jgi:hypothetical protein
VQAVLKLNQEIHEYNKRKDLVATRSKPKPPDSNESPPPSPNKLTPLDGAIFPSLSGVSPTCAGPSTRKNDKGDDEPDAATGPSSKPLLEQAHPAWNGKGKESEAVFEDDGNISGNSQVGAILLPKSRAIKHTLFDYGFTNRGSSPAMTLDGVARI